MFFLLIVIYVAFVALGLPDTILGAAWPLMRLDLAAPLSAAGILSIIVSIGTIIASLITPRLIRFFGTGKLVAYSIALTAFASVGYGFANSFTFLCLCAIPMGIGGGAVDVAMNNFAAIYLESKHTNWLHASWGIGATLGPAFLSLSIFAGKDWRGAYEIVAILLAIIFVMTLVSLPLWKKTEAGNSIQGNPSTESRNDSTPRLREVLRIPGMKLSFMSFFFYSALEISTSLWCGTYLVACGFKPEIGHRLIYAGIFIVIAGCFVLSMPLPLWVMPICICLLGLGCAPVYPSLIHATPARFGEAISSQAISIQLAGSYVGSILMPPAFGVIAAKFSVHLWPVALSIFVGLLLLCVCLLDYVTHRKLNKSYARERVMDILHEISMEDLKRIRRMHKKKKKH